MSAVAEMLGERQYASRYSIEPVGLQVYKAGVPADADGNAVTVRMASLDGLTVIFDRAATRTDVGSYETLVSSQESSIPGFYRVTWTYDLDGVPQTFEGILEVGESSPAYDALDVGMKGIVEAAWVRLADLFDSPYGGPNLQFYFQARFNRNRMAQLLRIALGKLNTVAQPHMTYTLEGPPHGNQFPYARWGALLEQALWIEVIKHLRRSYTEQPEAVNVNVARMDRRDYVARWGEILRDEEQDFKNQLDGFKIAHMGLSRPHVLVSGGVYGSYGPTRLAASAAARPRYWARFY